jgi:hypothetical protein
LQLDIAGAQQELQARSPARSGLLAVSGVSWLYPYNGLRVDEALSRDVEHL